MEGMEHRFTRMGPLPKAEDQVPWGGPRAALTWCSGSTMHGPLLPPSSQWGTAIWTATVSGVRRVGETQEHELVGGTAVQARPPNINAANNLDSVLKSRHHFAGKGLSSQSYGFSISHVLMWELDHKESRVSKNWCFWTVVLEKTLESPLGCKKTKPLIPKGNQLWIVIGRTDAEAETPILWPPGANSQLIGKIPDVGKDWRQKEKGATEDEI